jgi:aminopeptidase-like protein/aminoglycoside N3'-acetyltransferase
MTSYSEADLLAALWAAGVESGDLLFVHIDLDALGEALDGATAADRHAMVLRALRRAIGENGTLVVPTYTFSFCRQQDFDTARTPAVSGPWSPSSDFLNYVLQQPGAVRSRDPIHSVAALGPAAQRLLHALPNTCFGPDSVPHRLRRAGGKICLIGVAPHESAMVHHAEVMMRVPYRYKKLFTGSITHNGVTRREGWIFDVRIQTRNAEMEPLCIAHEAIEREVLRTEALGCGALHVMKAQPFYDTLAATLTEHPWFFVKGPPGDPNVFDAQRVSGSVGANASVGVDDVLGVTLPADAPMPMIIDRLWRLPRDIISDGYDAALAALATQLPMRIHEYPSGTECFTWIVPEKWTCHEAWLETMDGRRLFSYRDHPLHVVSYSLPFEGVVSREELLRHLYVHETLPDALPFIFKYYDRDWGLCCTRMMRDSLNDAHYKVVIRTSFSYGTLKVGEVTIPGSSDQEVVLCAHLCHPGMATDDLTGVAVGIDVMRALFRRRTPLRHTYRLLILPETIGSVAYLSNHESLIPHIAGGLFLEMLGLDHPHALQRSFAADTEIDDCCIAALNAHDPLGWSAPYRELLGNDERQFNAPGIRVPMLSLLRVLPTSHPDYPYREYHSSFDTPAIVSARRLEESRDLVLAMIDTLEANRVPVNRFKGEVCCSRFGLHIDWYQDPEGHRALFRIMDLIDGTRSIVQIAKACNVAVDTVTRVLDALQARDLIDYREAGCLAGSSLAHDPAPLVPEPRDITLATHLPS